MLQENVASSSPIFLRYVIISSPVSVTFLYILFAALTHPLLC